MRIVPLLVLAACGGSSSAPVTAVGNGTIVTAGAAGPYDHAALIVRARMQVHGGIPTLDVERIYKGACDSDLMLEPEATPRADTEGPGTQAIYFLAKTATPDSWHVIAAEPTALTLSPAREPEVIAALASVPATVPSAGWSADLTTFRSVAGTPWSLAHVPAITAGVRIFAGISFIGMTPDHVEHALGAPDQIQGQRWQYARHTGEAGLLRALTFDRGRVVIVDITRTQ